MKTLLEQKILESLSADTKGPVFVFLGQTRYLDVVAGALKDVIHDNKANFSLISFDMELTGEFSRLNARYCQEYLSKEDCFFIDELLFKKLGRSWFLDKRLKGTFSESERRVLGRCIEYNYYVYDLLLPIKYIEVMRQVFINNRPAKIIIIEDEPLLSDILGLFSPQYNFLFHKISPRPHFMPKDLIRDFTKKAKGVLADLSIIILDSLVASIISLFPRFKDKIIVDHRIYKDFSRSELKDRLLICPFEKGLKLRVRMFTSGLFYLPMRTPSYFEPLLEGLASFRRIRQWNKIKRSEDFRNLFNYKGILFWDVFEKHIRRLFLINFPRVKANMAFFQKFAQKMNIRLVIMRSDLKELERTLIEAARPLKIPSLVIQLGVIGNINMSDTLLADMTAVWGKGTIDWFRQYGYPVNKFTVTGNPGYDELYQRIVSSNHEGIKKEVCRKLNMEPSKKIIAFLTSSNYLNGTSFVIPNEMSLILEEILRTLESISEIQLIVKLHPYDQRLPLYEKIIGDYRLSGRARVVKDFSTYDILEASDLAVMRTSSTGLAALILDKPLISVMLFKGDFVKVPYAQDGAALAAKKIDEIGPAIKDCLYDEKVKEGLKLRRQEFVFNYAYKIDGQATQRVEGLVNKMVNNNIFDFAQRD